MKKLNAALFLLGVALLGYLVWRVGPVDLWHQLRHLSWGVLLLIVSEGLANLAHTVGWRYCLSPSLRRVSLVHLFRLVTAGYALNYLTPSASVGGEVARASLLASSGSGAEAVSSVLVDKLSTAFAHLLLVMFGAVLLLGCVSLPPALWAAMAVTSALIAAGMVAFLLLQKHGKLGALLRWLATRRPGRRATPSPAAADVRPLHSTANEANAAFPRLLQFSSQLDQTLAAFYREHPLSLALSILWHLVGHSVAIFQTWSFLYLMHQHASLLASACAAFLGLWFDLLTFAVPLNLGTLEGGRIVALKAVGCEAVMGVAYGLALRLAQLFWAAFGLVSYGLLLSRTPASRCEERVKP